jgi:hypothetical protein
VKRRALLAACLTCTAVLSLDAYLKIGTDTGTSVVGLRWVRQPIRYFVTNRDVAGVSAPALQAALGRAFAAWGNVRTARVASEFVGFVDAGPSEEDGASVIGFEERPDLERVLGTTSFTFDETTGEILEADILINSTFAWSVASGGESSRFDLESILVHEVGHLLGLGHSALGETDLVDAGRRRVVAKRAVMFPIAYPPGNIEDRTLEADDMAGLSDIYSTAEFRTDLGSVGGRVRRDGAGVFGAHVVAFHLATGSMTATFSLTPQGDFVLAGLRPGAYVVRAEPIDDADVESFFEADAGVDVDFTPAYASQLAIVPSGGSGPSIDISVVRK